MKPMRIQVITSVICVLVTTFYGMGQDAQPTTTPQDTKVTSTDPLAGFTLIHDGNYGPSTMEAFDALGIDDVTVIWQGMDPYAEETGLIDVDSVLLQMREKYPDGLQGWLQIDFERPFVGILRNEQPDARFDQTVENLSHLVTRIQELFPETKVTIYCVPSIHLYSLQDNGKRVPWGKLTDEQRETTLRRLDRLKPLLDKMDWFLPRFYDSRPSALLPEDKREQIVGNENDLRRAHVEWLRDYVDQSDRPDREIIPVVRTRYVAGSGGYEHYVGKLIPMDEFVHEQVQPAIDAGADGLYIWGGAENHALHIAFTNPDNWSKGQLKSIHTGFRDIGVLEEDEVPDWQNAKQKRAFRAALGHAESPYVAATIRLFHASRLKDREDSTTSP